MKEANLNRAVMSYLMLFLQHHDVLDDVADIWLVNISLDQPYYNEVIFEMIFNESSERFGDKVAYTLSNSFISWAGVEDDIDQYPKLKMLLEEGKNGAGNYGVALYDWCCTALEKLEELSND